MNLLEILCTNSGGYDSTAGAPAGSYEVKTNVTLNLLGLFKGELTAESPAFTAVGSGGGSLSLARSFVPGGLLPLTPQFTYTANLVDKTTNTKQKAISETIEGEAPFAAKSGGVTLTAGHSYVVQIETTSSSTVAGIGLLGEAVGRFDNVAVSGPDAPSNSGGNDGANGGNGGNGANGGAGDQGASGASGGNGGAGGGVSSARLESLIKSSSLVGAATLKGNRLSVKAKCPAKVGATCTLKLQGLLNRHKAATAARRARVKQGKVKNFAMVVKPAARKVVRKRSKLLVKETVRAGKAKATVYKTLKLIRK